VKGPVEPPAPTGYVKIIDRAICIDGWVFIYYHFVDVRTGYIIYYGHEYTGDRCDKRPPDPEPTKPPSVWPGPITPQWPTTPVWPPVRPMPGLSVG
jgi:hypothetical protein